MSKLTRAEVLAEDRRRLLEDSARCIEAMGLPRYLERLRMLEETLAHGQTNQS